MCCRCPVTPWKNIGKISRINSRIELDFLEEELYYILNREKEVDWDYDYTINLHLSVLEKNLNKLEKED